MDLDPKSLHYPTVNENDAAHAQEEVELESEFGNHKIH